MHAGAARRILETRPVGAPQDEVEAFETGSKLREIFFRPHRKKKVGLPHLGDARRPFRSHYRPTIGQKSQSHFISAREAACWKLRDGVVQRGLEVLANYALNSIEFTD